MIETTLQRKAACGPVASGCELLDTYSAFWDWWATAQKAPPADQVESWAQTYMARWPELLAAQIEDYAQQGLNWRQVARTRVFPHLAERLSAMHQAHQILVESVDPLATQAQQALAFTHRIIFVIYVGIGCGAGWATTYGGSPAILLGLENIAECGWTTPVAIAGLITHEIGHLVHQQWRQEHGKALGKGPWWQLYEEGFAHRCATLILGAEAWHQASGQAGWLDWCRRHCGQLAVAFIKAAEEDESVAPFLGSWFEVHGWRETGYYLGHEAIKTLEERLTLQEIALLEDVEAHLKPILKEIQSL